MQSATKSTTHRLLQWHQRSNLLKNCVRCSSSNKEIKLNPNFQNRNPRNLEMLCLKKRDIGWGTKQGDNFEVGVENEALNIPQRNYYNVLKVYQSKKHTHVEVEHYSGSVILSASTAEWWISKQLHRGYGVAAAINMGQIIGERCLRAGITSVSWGMPDEVTEQSESLQEFKKALVQSGVDVQEPPVKEVEYKIHRFKPPYEKYNIKS